MKGYINEKFQWHHRETKRRLSGFYSVLNKPPLQYRVYTFGETEFYTEQVFWNVSKIIQIWSNLNKSWYQMTQVDLMRPTEMQPVSIGEMSELLQIKNMIDWLI